MAIYLLPVTTITINTAIKYMFTIGVFQYSVNMKIAVYGFLLLGGVLQ